MKQLPFLLLALLGCIATLLATIIIGTLFGVGRIPGVVEPGYIHTDDLIDPEKSQ